MLLASLFLNVASAMDEATYKVWMEGHKAKLTVSSEALEFSRQGLFTSSSTSVRASDMVALRVVHAFLSKSKFVVQLAEDQPELRFRVLRSDAKDLEPTLREKM